MCLRCNVVEESAIHAIRNCQKAKDILRLGNVDGRLLEKPWNYCIDWLEESMHFLDKQAFECLILLLWNIWNSKNNLLFTSKDEKARYVWNNARNFLEDFQIHNLLHPRLIPKIISPVKWKKTPDGIIKVNVDAAWHEDGMAISMLTRDSYRLMLGGCMCFIEELFDSIRNDT